MDNHIVKVTVEYHIMAQGSTDAIVRVMDNLEHRDQDLTPYNVAELTVEKVSNSEKG